MKREVAYFSKFGNAAVLAKAIVSMLPVENTKLTDLARSEMSGGADVNFIGFDVNDGPVPLRIMVALDYAEDKVLILFATCWMMPSWNIRAAVERKLQPVLPDSCDYRGLFLCAGQAPESMMDNPEAPFKTHPDNTEIKAAFGNCQKTIGHPSERDIERLQRFVQTVLSM